REGEGLLVREHLAVEAKLQGAGADPSEELAVDPHGSLEQALVGADSGVGWGEVDHPAIATVDEVGAAQAIGVLLGEGDLERQRGGLFGLDQRDLRELLAPPLDTVEVEALPGPIEALAALEEEGTLEGGFDGTGATTLETQAECVDRAVV